MRGRLWWKVGEKGRGLEGRAKFRTTGGSWGARCCFSSPALQAAIRPSSVSDFHQQANEPIFTWGFRNGHRRHILRGHLTRLSFSLALEP